MLPLSVEDTKKSDDRRPTGHLIKRRVFESILIFNAVAVYLVSLFAHVSGNYRIPLIGIATIANLLIYLFPLPHTRFPRWLQTLTIPLILGTGALVGLVVVAKNVPSIALSHNFFEQAQIPGPLVPMDGSVSISVIIPARNEDAPLLINTFKYLFIETPDVLLKEVIVVDDQSDDPIQAVIDEQITDQDQRSKIRVIRLDERQGLTNAKTIGAEQALGTHIFFLDGHCRVAPNYAERMLGRSLSESPSDIIVPEVIDVDGETFSFKSMNGGVKMMFEWNFEFSWFDNNKTDDRVPVSSGGILLMTRREFITRGKYDRGQLEWGGENIEQSLRSWLCGGRVIVERGAKIGHVFHRKLKPGRVQVATVERNHARAAFVWLDDWLKYFEVKHRRGNMMLSEMGPYIDERLEWRHRLKCGKFDDFVNLFEPVFDQRNLYMDRDVSIQDMQSGLCITGKQLNETGKVRDRPVQLIWDLCQMYDNRQRFGTIMDGQRIRSSIYERCFQRDTKSNELKISACDLALKNRNQDWKFKDEKIQGTEDNVCLQSSLDSTGFPKVGAQVMVGACEHNVASIRELYRGIDRN